MPADLHAHVSATVLAQLETADSGSWTPPWHGADPLPRNAHTGRRYRGLNILALWCAAQANGYADARWATYRQWAALGGQVRRAEQGTLVLFYKDLPRDVRPSDADPDTKTVPFVARAAHVFNIVQVDVASIPAEAVGTTTHQAAPPAFDAFVAATRAVIHEGGTRACYVPATDTIHLPAPPSTPLRAGPALSRTNSSTGRVRDTASPETFRAASALTPTLPRSSWAELGAAFVLADLGLARTPHPNHAAYCASWAPLLRADPRALSHAAAQGSRAADYLAGLKPGSRAAPSMEDAGNTVTVRGSKRTPPSDHARLVTAITSQVSAA